MDQSDRALDSQSRVHRFESRGGRSTITQMETAGARRAVCLGTALDGWRIFPQTGPRFSLLFLANIQQTGRARFNRFDRLMLCQTAVRNCARFSQDFCRISGGNGKPSKIKCTKCVWTARHIHDCARHFNLPDIFPTGNSKCNNGVPAPSPRAVLQTLKRPRRRSVLQTVQGGEVLIEVVVVVYWIMVTLIKVVICHQRDGQRSINTKHTWSRSSRVGWEILH